MSDLEEYVRKSTEPVMNVSSLWEEKTGKTWAEAKALGLSDGSYNGNIKLLNDLKSGANQEAIPYIGGTLDMEELKMIVPKEKRVRQQQTIVKQGEYNQDQPYAIVDKGDNNMFLFGDDHNLISREKVITGTDNKDKEMSLHMRQWFEQPENKGKDHGEYFKYLDETQGQITESGMFTIGKHRKDVLENPNKKKDLFNTLFRPQAKKDNRESRAKSYGAKGELFTMYNEDGVYSSKAIHGTGYEDRVRAIAEGKGGDMSNGCINVGGESLCFDTLEEGSRVFVMPEETNDLVKPKKASADVKPTKEVNKADKYIRDMMYKMKSRNIGMTEEEAKKIYTIHEAESKLGEGYGIKDKVGDFLGIAKSRGEFQINEDTFSEHIANPDYNYRDKLDQTEVVLDFVRRNENLSLTELYNKYNTGSKDRKSNNQHKVRKMQKILGLK